MTPPPETPVAVETLEQIAARITREYSIALSQTGKRNLHDAILSALRNERDKAFDQGYVCAVANIMTLHGETVIAREVLNQNRPKNWSSIDRLDREALRPILKYEESDH